MRRRLIGAVLVLAAPGFAMIVAMLAALGWRIYFTASRLLRDRRDSNGWIGACLLFFVAVVIVVPRISTDLHLRKRAQEVASWPRASAPA